MKGLQTLAAITSFTIEGENLINEINTLIDDFLNFITADKSRQLVVDFSATMIKSGNLLNTPQTKELIDHFAILMCRFVDVISTPSAKHLYHNMADLIWAVIEILTDTKTVTAFAEVIANICYNLEMEKRLHRRMTRMNLSNEEKANQRKKRARFHRHIFLNKEEFNDNDIGKNDSIKNVLEHAFQISPDERKGMRKRKGGENCSTSSTNEIQSLESMPPRDVAVKYNTNGESYDDVVSLPLSSSIMTESPSIYLNDTQSHLEVMKEKSVLAGEETYDLKNEKASVSDDINSIKSTMKENKKIRDEFGNYTLNSKDHNIDIEDMFFARAGASKTNTSEERLNRRVYNEVLQKMQEQYVCFEEEKNNSSKRDKDDIDSCETDKNSLTDCNIQVDYTDLTKEYDTCDPAIKHPQSLHNHIPGSSTTTKFYEAFENKTKARRIATMQSILNSSSDNIDYANGRGIAKAWFPSASDTYGAGNELGHDILEQYLSTSKNTHVNFRKPSLRHHIKKTNKFSIANILFNRITLIIFVISLMCFVCISCLSLGVYGLLMLANSKNKVWADIPKQEVTVRIIREISLKTDRSDSSVLPEIFHDGCLIITEESLVSTDFILRKAIAESLKSPSCAKNEVLPISTATIGKMKGGSGAEIVENESE